MKFFDAIFKASKIFGYQATLQLTEYRELYKIGRIKNEVLKRIIKDTKSTSQVEEWKHNLLHKEYDTSNSVRIGLLRANWKSIYKIDLDNLVQPLLFRILCSYLDQGILISRLQLRKTNHCFCVPVMLFKFIRISFYAYFFGHRFIVHPYS